MAVAALPSSSPNPRFSALPMRISISLSSSHFGAHQRPPSVASTTPAMKPLA